jgi:ribulose-phosphate 3-epimerase
MADTPRDVLIAPSVLAADFARLGEEVAAVETAGADWIHVDVMDGHFVPNLTLGPDIVSALKRHTRLPLDVHLMIERPELYVEDFVKAGAATVGVHVEACPHLHRNLTQIRELGARACVVLNPGTPAHSIEPVLEHLDQVLVMTVNPGFGGQKFIESALPTVRQIRDWVVERELPIDIEVDGGIGSQNVGLARNAGANVFVAGSAVFGKPKDGTQPDYAGRISAIRENADR